jgi:hypothetical protein
VSLAASGADPYLAAVLSTWAASGRECVDASGFTGVKFDISGTATDVIFKVAISATDPSGHCAPLADCYGHPQAIVSMGTGVEVPFSSLAPPAWGNMAPFNATQVISLVWATSDPAANFTVSNVTFY